MIQGLDRHLEKLEGTLPHRHSACYGKFRLPALLVECFGSLDADLTSKMLSITLRTSCQE